MRTLDFGKKPKKRCKKLTKWKLIPTALDTSTALFKKSLKHLVGHTKY